MSVPERYWCWTATGAGEAPAARRELLLGLARRARRPGRSTPAPSAGSRRSGDLRPDLALEPGGAVLSTWSDDPWAGAAYSTSPPRELAELAARPTGPLAFAGEHLGGEFAALMEGAIRSGRAAARALIEAADA